MTDYSFVLYNKSFGFLFIPDEDEPIGWDSINFTIRRHDKFHGVFPEISTNLKWFCSAYDFITKCYSSEGIDTEILISIRGNCNNSNIELYSGRLDLSTAVWTEKFVECDIKAFNCLDLFLDRIDVPVNLYEDPCFSELTMDKTAYRTRYAFAPYLVEFPELPIIGQFVGKPRDCGPTGFEGQLFPLAPPTQYHSWLMWEYSPSINDLSAWNDDYTYPSESFGVPPIPPPATPVDSSKIPPLLSPQSNYFLYKDEPICGSTFLNVDFKIRWRFKIENVQGALPTTFTHNILQGSLEVKFGLFSTSIWTLPAVINTTGMPGVYYSDYFEASFAGSLTPAPGNYLQIFLWLDQDIQSGGGNYLFVTAEVDSTYDNRLILTADGCIDQLPPAGSTYVNSYAIHEAFSRVTEHYTNNCLRVKSDYFSRPNSMQWADDCEVQNPVRCTDPYYGYEIGSLATSNCDCMNPEAFPICGETFDPAPFQSDPAGCGAWTIVTNGLNIREFGKDFFVSFTELFDAMNSIHGIGVGFTENDPSILRVEKWDYFYQKTFVIDLGFVDLYNSKWKQSIASDYYFNRFINGYTEWLQDEINTIDEFNSRREYLLKTKNTTKAIEMQNNFIASGYAIEWQRRQRNSVDAKYDDNPFVVCVGRSIDINNQYTVQNSTPATVAYHMYRVETGVDFCTGLLKPNEAYNWRIRPLANALRWLEYLSIGLWHKDNIETIDFAKGTANYDVCGADLNLGDGCGYAINCEKENIQKMDTAYVRIFPEYVTIEHPITVTQYNSIKINPYGLIYMNNEPFFLKELQFKPNANSTLTLIRANV